MTTPIDPGEDFPIPPLLLATTAHGAIDDAAFRTIVDAVPQMMWVNDADGAVRFFNRFALGYLGRPNEELEGRRWLAYLHDDDRAQLVAGRTAAIVAGMGYTIEGRFRRHDGAYRWQRFEVQPVRGPGGAIAAWIGSARDIHDDYLRDVERERLLAEVSAERATFRAVYEQLPVGLTIVEAPHGRLIRYNGAAERILGHAMLPSDRVADYARYGGVHADGRPMSASEYPSARALAGESIDGEPMRYRRGDGREAMLRISAAPVRDAAGAITHAVVTFVDVTAEHEAERALAEREERLRAALDASSTGTFRWDIRTDALDWDLNLDRLFGLEPGQTARSLDQFIGAVHPDDRARVVAACARCAAEGADFDEELRVVWPDGTLRWLHDKGRTYRDGDGKPLYMTGACVDITARRRQQDELRALAETMPQLVWMADATGMVDYFNARWAAYTGRAPGAPGIAAWPDAVHPDDRAETLRRWDHAVRTGEPYEVVYRLRRADGAYRWFVGRAAPSRDENGRVTRWFGSCTDIHDEVLVRERLERLNAISEALGGALGVEDVARTVMERGTAAVGALSGAVALLRPDGATLELHGAINTPEAARDAWATFPLDAPVPMAEVARTGRARFFESRDAMLAEYPALRDAIGGRGIASAAVLPLEWAGRRAGSVRFAFGEARPFDQELRTFLEALATQCAQAIERARLHELERDARHEAEAARRVAEEAQAEAQRANFAKGRFLAMMSHDLRTPINATLGYLDLLALEIRGPLVEAQRLDLERMRRSQQLLLALVNEVLDYTRIDAGRTEVRLEALSVAGIASDVGDAIAPLAAAKGLAYTADTPDPSLAVLADRDRVRQVLLNLLANAVKFTDTGTVRLTTDADATTVRLCVTDTGPGIAADRLSTIFEPFVQVDTASADARREGLGLGLAIARELARAMGGEVTVESEEGVGSTFTVALVRA